MWYNTASGSACDIVWDEICRLDQTIPESSKSVSSSIVRPKPVFRAVNLHALLQKPPWHHFWPVIIHFAWLTDLKSSHNGPSPTFELSIDRSSPSLAQLSRWMHDYLSMSRAPVLTEASMVLFRVDASLALLRGRPKYEGCREGVGAMVLHIKSTKIPSKT